MRVVALISGGKDSCYNMMQCVAIGHQIVALANLRPAESRGNIDELDSYMYQTVGYQAIHLYAEAMALPLYCGTIRGTSVETGKMYTECEGDEVEDLYQLLKLIKEKEFVEGVSVGAILSDYQRVRVENVCKRLNLQPLTYLWRQNQEILLKEMISSKIDAIIIKVAAFGLDPEKHLGKTLSEMESCLIELSRKYGVHVCGEGGEYETFTLDCPLFQKRIVVDTSEIITHSADAFAPVAYLRLLQLHLEEKPSIRSSNMLITQSCPCIRTTHTTEDDTPCSQEKGQEGEDAQPIIWKSSRTEFLPTCKSLESSGLSPSGYCWISGISVQLNSSKGDSVQDSIQQAFISLQGRLEAQGLVLKDIVLVHLYIRKMTDFTAINSVYGMQFDICHPARVCVESSLPADILFRMDCLIHQRPVVTADAIHSEREIMHVQSISHWAPANIGPYSQAIKVEGELIFCAGQIALVPCTMQLVTGGILAEAEVSLNHVKNVLEAMNHGTTLHHVLIASCYVTHYSHIHVANSIWQRKLKEQREEEKEGEDGGGPRAVSGILVVVVVPHLPRGSAIEWHVIAATDNPWQRKNFKLSRRLPGCQIECEAVELSCNSSASISLALSWHCPSLPPIGLEQALKELFTLFLKALEWLVDDSLIPLCFRTFYKTDSVDTEDLQTGFGKCLEEALGNQAPALVLVPVVDLPNKEVVHVVCWLAH
uniref:Diphthine--ammonia ligase n=1 Tax=Geotrypetes seraphini TaxID=260995 RepID=A0A6P8RQV8_GEOSA|nr:diphthine--ammonia ligase isoform X2 [Geotrypetes seraphini]